MWEKKIERVARGGEREVERKEERGWKSSAKKGDSDRARLLNLRRLYVVNEPDMLYAFARTREHYETRNKVPERKRNVRSSIVTKILVPACSPTRKKQPYFSSLCVRYMTE